MDTSGNATYSNEDPVYENPFSSGEEDNMGEDMYVNDSFHDPNDKVAIKTIQKGPGSEPVVPFSSSWRAAAVCLGLLCALLLAGIIALGVVFTRVNEDKTMERDQLQTSYTILSRERDDLQRRLCEGQDGWTRFGCSCYYVSNETKTWADSRQDCIDGGADLVIINSPEEQNFLNNLNKRVWIGLTDTATEGNFFWVDGTPLTTEYWFVSQPDIYLHQQRNVGEDCAEILYSPSGVPPLKTWNYIRCDSNKYWVCERGI